MSEMARVVAFIDGFNMYHSIDGKYNHLKWLNYNALANAFIAKSRERLAKVFYFSAYSRWNEEKKNRHMEYVRALEFTGVEAVLGKFKRVSKKCRAVCKKTYTTFEEKETDVNIAIYLLKLAFQDRYDKALIFSGDSDLIPAVKAVREIAPHKHIQVVIPVERPAEDLKKCCDSSAQVKIKHLASCQFPDPLVIDAARRIVIARPASWM